MLWGDAEFAGAAKADQPADCLRCAIDFSRGLECLRCAIDFSGTLESPPCEVKFAEPSPRSLFGLLGLAISFHSVHFQAQPWNEGRKNDNDFTRIVEIKHATGQINAVTTMFREYPKDFAPGRERSYPSTRCESAL